MASLAACPNVLAPETSVCSGRGTCVMLGGMPACACDQPHLWTGEGDHIFGSPTCAISVPAVQALHGVLLLIALRAFADALVYAYQRLGARRSGGARRRRKCLVMDRNVVVTSWLLLGAGGYVAYSLYRIIRPRAGTGSDLVGTLLFCHAGTTYSALVVLFIYNLLAMGFSRSGLSEDELAHVRFLLQTYWVTGTVLLIVNIACILLMLILYSPEAFGVLVPMQICLHAVFLMFGTFYYTTVFKHMTDWIRRRIGARARDGYLSEILNQIDALRKNAIAACFIYGAIFLTLAGWEGLRQIAYPYIFPATWVSGLLLQSDVTRILRKGQGLGRGNNRVGEAASANELVNQSLIRAIMDDSTRQPESSGLSAGNVAASGVVSLFSSQHTTMLHSTAVFSGSGSVVDGSVGSPFPE